MRLIFVFRGAGLINLSIESPKTETMPQERLAELSLESSRTISSKGACSSFLSCLSCLRRKSKLLNRVLLKIDIPSHCSISLTNLFTTSNSVPQTSVLSRAAKVAPSGGSFRDTEQCCAKQTGPENRWLAMLAPREFQPIEILASWPLTCKFYLVTRDGRASSASRALYFHVDRSGVSSTQVSGSRRP
jgi:hypothetical protein